MKTPWTTGCRIFAPVLLIMVGCCCGIWSAQGAGELQLPVLKTATVDYAGVKVFNRTKTHLSFSHDQGVAVIKLADVAPESMEALERARTTVTATSKNEAPSPTIVESFTTSNNPERDAKWATLTRGVSQNLPSASLPVKVTPQLLWCLAGALVFAWFFHCYCCALICRKVGRPGGFLVCLPMFQLFPLLRAAGMSGWWFLAMFVPVLNAVTHILWCVKITQARGKGFLTAIMLILPITNLLAFLYLAFSNGHVEREGVFVRVAPPRALAVGV